MRPSRVSLLALIVLIPALGESAVADQRNSDPDKPLACNSMCSWWMAMADKPAPTSNRPHDGTALPAPVAQRVAAATRSRRQAALPRMAARAVSHAHVAVTRVAVSRPLGPARPAVVAELARPARPTVLGPVSPPPVAVLPTPAPMLVAATDAPRTAASVPAQPVTEARAERVRLPAPDRATPTIGVSMQSAVPRPVPQRARMGLMAVAALCALALSLGRTGRARVAVPAAAHRRRERPLLDAFKSERRMAAKRA